MSEELEMIVCIPGPWQSRTDLIEALIKAHDGRYLWAGMILLDSQDNDHLSLEWKPQDPRMLTAFHACSGDEETLAAIENHGSVIYARFPMNVPDQRERLLKYTDVLRKAGGIAVKLETCGISHPWQRWFEWLSSPFADNHYRATVIVAGDSTGWYSCGMHHFRLPDAIVNDGLPEAADTLEAFNKYLLIESPDLKSGHTFSKDTDSPRRRLRWTEDTQFEPDHLFHNPHGLWNLDSIDS